MIKSSCHVRVPVGIVGTESVGVEGEGVLVVLRQATQDVRAQL